MLLQRLTRPANKVLVLTCLLAATTFLAGSWQARAQATSDARIIGTPSSPESMIRLGGHTPRKVKDGTAIRVQTPNVSLVSLDVNLAKKATASEINAAMQDASKGELAGILDYNTAPLVSIDFNHNPASSTFDATQTTVVDGELARVLAWYDNEWGFSNRMSDTAALLGSL